MSDVGAAAPPDDARPRGGRRCRRDRDVTPSLVADGFIHLSAARPGAPAGQPAVRRARRRAAAGGRPRRASPTRCAGSRASRPTRRRCASRTSTGPLPSGAVTSVLPYRPGADGGVRRAGHAAPRRPARPGRGAFDRSLAVARGPQLVLPVTGGVAAARSAGAARPTSTTACGSPASWPAARSVADADRGPGRLRHRRGESRPARRPRTAGVAGRQERRVLVLDPAPSCRAVPGCRRARRHQRGHGGAVGAVVAADAPRRSPTRRSTT